MNTSYIPNIPCRQLFYTVFLNVLYCVLNVLYRKFLPLVDCFKLIKPIFTRRGCHCAAAFYTVSYSHKSDLDPALPFTTLLVLHSSSQNNPFVRNLACQIESYPLKLKLKHMKFPLSDIGVFSVYKVKYLAQTILLNMA
jgi:hypothetical protein